MLFLGNVQVAKIISYSINIKCKNITLGMILACVCNSHANTFGCMRIGCMPVCRAVMWHAYCMLCKDHAIEGMSLLKVTGGDGDEGKLMGGEVYASYSIFF